MHFSPDFVQISQSPPRPSRLWVSLRGNCILLLQRTLLASGMDFLSATSPTSLRQLRTVLAILAATTDQTLSSSLISGIITRGYLKEAKFIACLTSEFSKYPALRYGVRRTLNHLGIGQWTPSHLLMYMLAVQFHATLRYKKGLVQHFIHLLSEGQNSGNNSLPQARVPL